MDQTYDVAPEIPRSVGYSFLQRVSKYTGNSSDSAVFNFKWRKGYKYFNSRPFTVGIIHRTAGDFTDPDFEYNGTLQFYNLMRGYKPEPVYPSSSLFYRPVEFGGPFGGYGTYMLDGDPVTGSGWIDGISEAYGDRRL